MRHLAHLATSIFVLLLLVAVDASAASHGGGGPGGGGGGGGGGNSSTSGGGSGGGGTNSGGGANDPTGVATDPSSSVVGNAYDVVFTFADGRMQRAKLVFTAKRVKCEVIAAAGADSLEFSEQKGKSEDAPVVFDATGPGAKGSQLELSGKAKSEGIKGELIITPKQGEKIHSSFIGGKPGSDQAQRAIDALEKAPKR
jgi:hypothetical protein